MTQDSKTTLAASRSEGGNVFASTALIVVAVAPVCFGCQPPWASGILLSILCLLGALHLILRMSRGQSGLFDAHSALNVLSILLAAWLAIVVLWDVFAPESAQRIPAVSLRKLPYVFAFLSAALLGHSHCSSNAGLRQTLRAFSFSALVLAAFALLQWYGWDIKSLLGWDPSVRSSGLYTNPNRFAVAMSACWFCTMAIVVSELWLRRSERSVINFAVAGWMIAAGSIAACIALTLSRLTMASVAFTLAALSVAALVLLRKSTTENDGALSPPDLFRRRMLLSLPIMLTILWAGWCFVIANDSLRTRITDAYTDQSFSNRLIPMKVSLPLIQSDPVFGHGLGSFESAFTALQPATLEGRWREVHNDWLQLAIEAGLPAAGLAIALSLVWFAAVWKRLRETDASERVFLRLLPVGAIGVALVCSLADFPLREPATAALVFFLAGGLCSREAAPGHSGIAGKSVQAGLVILMLGAAVVSARNGVAYLSSPWSGYINPPVRSAAQFADWKRALEIDCGDPELQFRFSSAAYLHGDLRMARNAASRAAQLNPLDYRFPFLEAGIAERQNDVPAATQLRNKAAQLAPFNPGLQEQNARYFLYRAVLSGVGEPERDAALEQALSGFRAILKAAPFREPDIIRELDDAGLLPSEIAQLWNGDDDHARISRARYYFGAQQWHSTERQLPGAEPTGKADAAWYYALSGALALKRQEIQKGSALWEKALLDTASVNEELDRWMAGIAHEMDATACESISERTMERLAGSPILAGVLAEKLIAAQRMVTADKVLERVTSKSPNLRAMWAELALQMGDFSAASKRARTAWELEMTSPARSRWYEDFKKRLRTRQEQNALKSQSDGN